jgi:hypothetical protein
MALPPRPVLPLDYRAGDAGSRPGLAPLALTFAHRLGAAAFLLLLGAATAYFADREYRALLLLAFVAADLSVVGAVVASSSARRGARPDRESRNLLVFAGACLVLTAAGLAASLMLDKPL